MSGFLLERLQPLDGFPVHLRQVLGMIDLQQVQLLLNHGQRRYRKTSESIIVSANRKMSSMERFEASKGRQGTSGKPKRFSDSLSR